MSDQQATYDAPPVQQVAQAICLAHCAKSGFGGCTWNADLRECLDAEAAHFEEDAVCALATWVKESHNEG